MECSNNIIQSHSAFVDNKFEMEIQFYSLFIHGGRGVSFNPKINQNGTQIYQYPLSARCSVIWDITVHLIFDATGQYGRPMNDFVRFLWLEAYENRIKQLSIDWSVSDRTVQICNWKRSYRFNRKCLLSPSINSHLINFAARRRECVDLLDAKCQ